MRTLTGFRQPAISPQSLDPEVKRAVIPTPTVASLFGLFANSTECPACTPIDGSVMPEPYRSLLVHTKHMTVTVEGYFGQPVNVRVLDTLRTETEYARKILLTLRDTGEVVQFGIVQIDLTVLSQKVREEILGGKTPLGRVLIQNRVMRHIRPAGYFRAEPSKDLAGWFGSANSRPTYGRLGVIYADHKPAIEVLEILSPLAETYHDQR